MSTPPDPGLSAVCPPSRATRRRAAPLPIISRDGIRWTGGRGSRPLVLALSFENQRRRPTAPTTARVQVAEFGVFQTWRALTEVEVPAIEPGDREIVTGVAPGGSLPTMPEARDGEARILDVHYVGNINVFVMRDAAVERHVRRTIGLRSGRDNLSQFFVGNGEPDSYTFSVETCEPGWDFSLIRGDGGGAPIVLEEPILVSRECLTAIIHPPEGSETGRIAIAVERGSTGESATVEFELETSRLGSKCYYL